MSTSSTLRRVAVSVLALGAALLAGGMAPVGAATSTTPPVAGQVRFTGATITSTCDANGDIVARTVTASYDARALGTQLPARIGHGLYDAASGSTTFDTGVLPILPVRPGVQDVVTSTVNLPTPVAPSASADLFSVTLGDAKQPFGTTVTRYSAARQCGPVTAATAPAVSLSATRCDGSFDVRVDATGVTGDRTATLRVDLGYPLQLVVHPGDVLTRTLDLANARAGRLDVTFSAPGAVPQYPDIAHGLTAGPVVPDCPASTRGAIVPVTPTRVLDTRAGTGAPKAPVAANGRLVVTTPPTVPAGATAVAVNLTVTQPAASGYLQAWSSVAGPGTASVLNFVGGQTVSRSAILPLDGSGRFALANVSSGASQLLADVTGYAVGDGTPAAGDIVPLDATRLLDTRTAGGVPVAPGATVHVPVLGKAGIGSASAVALQVTAVGGTSAGYLTTWSGEGSLPGTSSLNYSRGQVVGAFAPTTVAADGTVAVTNTSAGTVHLLVDVEGWWRAGSGVTTGGLRSLTPRRVLDTRTFSAMGPGESFTVFVTGSSTDPDHLHGVSAVLVNLTTTSSSASGFLRAQPEGTPAAASSSLNFRKGEVVANQTLVGVSDTGRITVTNGSTGWTQVVVDLVAYITR